MSPPQIKLPSLNEVGQLREFFCKAHASWGLQRFSTSPAAAVTKSITEQPHHPMCDTEVRRAELGRIVQSEANSLGVKVAGRQHDRRRLSGG